MFSRANKYIFLSFALFLFSAFQLSRVYFEGTRPLLSRESAIQAYHQYSKYNEQYDMQSYLRSFPAEEYSLYSIPGYENFYLDNIDDAIKNYLRNGHIWEASNLKLISIFVKKGTNVIDVGAHIGTHTILMSKILGNSGTVWAFEPQKKLFVELNANLLANQAKKVRTLRYALGDHLGVIQMGLSTVHNEGGIGISSDPDSGGDKADLVTLDSLGIENVSFIKIDVEGYEDQVLDGAVETIKRSMPTILVEIQGGQRYELASPEEKKKILHTVNKLKDLGYEVVRVSPHDYLARPDLQHEIL